MSESRGGLTRPMLDRVLSAAIGVLSYVPVVNRYGLPGHRRWVRDEYTRFARSERKRVFMSIARFAHINRPIEGYYFEFGSHEGNSMRAAWDTFRYLFNWKYVAFDSFAGLPEMDKSDSSAIFRPGNLATAEERFVEIVTRHGMPRDKLTTIRGFYKDSLTPEVQRRFLPGKAAVIYVDCDLYESTVPVLRFVTPFLQVGTIVFFDDWNCFYGDPQRGERRAWAEFLSENPELQFEPFVSTGEGQGFICVLAGSEPVS